jgi:hypothetical protein
MLDLLLMAELVIFSLHAHDAITMHIDDELIAKIGSEIVQPVPSIFLAEDLLVKFEQLCITQKANGDNKELARNLLMRRESGILESLSELIGASLASFPDEERAAGLLA